MQRFLFAVGFCLLTGGALAQTVGAPAGGAASSPGAAAPTAPGARAATPGVAGPGAAGVTTPAPSPAAPLNTDVFPPSRLLQAPAPCSTSPAQSGSPAQSAGSADTAPAAGNASPGAPAAPDPNLPATASGGRAQPGGANSSSQSVRTGKNPIGERYADCIKLWDTQTHMSRADWARTCRRIENRLQNLQVEHMDVDVMGPKPRKNGKSSGSSG